jgi:hypothetical protein
VIFYGGGQHLFQESRKILRFINENREVLVVEKMSKVMSVSVSGYYYWLKEPVGAPTVKNRS